MPPADGRNLGGQKVKFYYLESPSAELKGKITADPPTVAVADIVGAGKAVLPANELKGVDEPGEYGQQSESQTEQPYGNPSYNVLGSTTISDIDCTYMPDLSNALDVKFAYGSPLGREVLFIEELTGNTPANKTYNVTLGVLGGVTRVANKGGSQRWRRRIIVAANAWGIAAA